MSFGKLSSPGSDWWKLHTAALHPQANHAIFNHVWMPWHWQYRKPCEFPSLSYSVTEAVQELIESRGLKSTSGVVQFISPWTLWLESSSAFHQSDYEDFYFVIILLVQHFSVFVLQICSALLSSSIIIIYMLAQSSTAYNCKPGVL